MNKKYYCYLYILIILNIYRISMIKLLPVVNYSDNNVYLNTIHSRKFANNFIIINNKFAFKVIFKETISVGQIGIGLHIKNALFGMETIEIVEIQNFEPNGGHQLAEIKFMIHAQVSQPFQIKINELENQIKKMKLIVNNGGYLDIMYNGVCLQMKINLLNSMDFGLIVDETILVFEKDSSQRVELIDDDKESMKLFQPRFQQNIKRLKVGGHSSQLRLIQRRVFATRTLNPRMVRLLGLKHIRGMLLYGPPGTGKTLIARQISKLLKVKPKIVNGPEIMNEFVGKSQQAIRNLFADAKKQQEEKGLKSQLHCIIFDEIDALCKKRGSQGVHDACDKVVAQLLTQIDGIQQLNNILVIGITNRKDLIDQALIRPGRLDVHIEIHIPDQQGRLQILNIHTELMKNNNILSDSVNLNQIANLAKNYTGAQLQGVVKSAQSFALQRWKLSPSEEHKMEFCKVTHQDFLNGLNQVRPQFGKDNRILQNLQPKKQLIIQKYQEIRSHLMKAIQNLQNGKHAFLIKGEAGVGKTALTAECALQAGYSFTKVISSDRMLGMNEGQVINQIVKIFQDSQKCNKSLIILDDLLRLIEYIALGNKYSTNILNLLINCIKKRIGLDKKQIIIATVGQQKILKDLGLSKYFKHTYTMEKLKGDELFNSLKQYNFEDESIRKIVKTVSQCSISRLADTTKIQGTKNVEGWLRCWKQSEIPYGE